LHYSNSVTFFRNWLAQYFNIILYRTLSALVFNESLSQKAYGMKPNSNDDIGANLPGGPLDLPVQPPDPGNVPPKPRAPGKPLQPPPPAYSPDHPKLDPDHDPDLPEKPGPPLQDPESPHPSRRGNAKQ